MYVIQGSRYRCVETLRKIVGIRNVCTNRTVKFDKQVDTLYLTRASLGRKIIFSAVRVADQIIVGIKGQ